MTKRFLSVVVLIALVAMTNGQLCRSHCSSKSAHHGHEQLHASLDPPAEMCPHHMKEEAIESNDGHSTESHGEGDQASIRCGCSDDNSAIAQETALSPSLVRPTRALLTVSAFRPRIKFSSSFSIQPPEEPPRV